MFSRSILRSVPKTMKRNFSDVGFVAQNRYPQMALAVACTAFCFQLTVLYPWHNELQENFNEVQLVIENTKNEGFARKALIETAKAEGLERKAIAEKLDKQLENIDSKLDILLELENVNSKLEYILEGLSNKK